MTPSPSIPFPHSRIMELNELLEVANKEVIKLRNLITASKQEWARAAYGVKEGQIVVSRGCKFEVARFDSIFHDSAPWLIARKIKNDGTPSLKSQFLCDWSKPE